MRELFADLDQWQREHQEVALATLVRVRGSAPRLPGAQLAVTRSGRMSGSISGGCVENDVLERAMQVLDGGGPVVVGYGISDQAAFEVGLSCGGRIDVLIERFAAGPAWNALRRALEAERAAALCTGLEPDSLRARRLAVLIDGSCIGSLDPELNPPAAVEARRLLGDGAARVVSLPWRGQQAKVFVEAFPAPLRLLVVGATHVAIPLCRMAKLLGFRITVVDPRSRFACSERLPEADEILTAWPDQALDAVQLDASSFVLTLTHDAKLDLPALARALRSPARYVGALGSRRTHQKRKQELRRLGFTDAELARIRSPVGLDLGGRSPEAIALAILAEMLAVRHGRQGGALSQQGATDDGDA